MLLATSGLGGWFLDRIVTSGPVFIHLFWVTSSSSLYEIDGVCRKTLTLSLSPPPSLGDDELIPENGIMQFLSG